MTFSLFALGVAVGIAVVAVLQAGACYFEMKAREAWLKYWREN